jgi:hypothetical protein
MRKAARRYSLYEVRNAERAAPTRSLHCHFKFVLPLVMAAHTVSENTCFEMRISPRLHLGVESVGVGVGVECILVFVLVGQDTHCPALAGQSFDYPSISCNAATR